MHEIYEAGFENIWMGASHYLIYLALFKRRFHRIRNITFYRHFHNLGISFFKSAEKLLAGSFRWFVHFRWYLFKELRVQFLLAVVVGI